MKGAPHLLLTIQRTQPAVAQRSETKARAREKGKVDAEEGARGGKAIAHIRIATFCAAEKRGKDETGV